MNDIVKASVTITSAAVVNLKKVVSFASSSPLINHLRWAMASVSAAVAGLALSRAITLRLVGIIEE